MELGHITKPFFERKITYLVIKLRDYFRPLQFFKGFKQKKNILNIWPRIFVWGLIPNTKLDPIIRLFSTYNTITGNKQDTEGKKIKDEKIKGKKNIGTLKKKGKNKRKI